MLSAILAAFLVLAGNVVMVVLAKRWIDNRLNALVSYFTAQGDKQSAFADLTDVIIDRAAQKLTTNLKMAILGVQSQASRELKAAQGEFVKDQISEAAPIAGMAIDAIPGLGKFVKKYPIIAALAQNALAGKLTGGEKSQQPTASPVAHNIDMSSY